MMKVLCFFFRHKPVLHYTFTKDYIYNRKCERCGCMLGMPLLRMHDFPPPGLTSTQVVKDWEEYVTRREQELNEAGIAITYIYEKG